MSEAGEAQMDHAEDEHSLGVSGGRSARLYRSLRRIAGNSSPRRLDALFPASARVREEFWSVELIPLRSQWVSCCAGSRRPR
jgi:hypothetical protein